VGIQQLRKYHLLMGAHHCRRWDRERCVVVYHMVYSFNGTNRIMKSTRRLVFEMCAFPILCPPQVQMLLCRVALGSCGTASSGIRRPPYRPDGVIHDSVSNNPKKVKDVTPAAAMYAVYDNRQAYIEYLITYR
jgi:hypothetical protein